MVRIKYLLIILLVAAIVLYGISLFRSIRKDKCSQHGKLKCECEAGFTGSDCSTPVKVNRPRKDIIDDIMVFCPGLDISKLISSIGLTVSDIINAIMNKDPSHLLNILKHLKSACCANSSRPCPLMADNSTDEVYVRRLDVFHSAWDDISSICPGINVETALSLASLTVFDIINAITNQDPMVLVQILERLAKACSYMQSRPSW